MICTTMALLELLRSVFSLPYVWESLSLLVLVALLPVTVRGVWRQWRIWRAFRNVPTVPYTNVLFGHIPQGYNKNTYGVDIEWFVKTAKKVGWRSFALHVGPFFDVLVCINPEGVKEVLKSDPKLELIYHPFKPFIGEGLLVANGAKWATHRRLLTPAFHFDILKPYIQLYGEVANTMMGIWSKQPEGMSYDVFPDLSLLTLDVMLRCAFSIESDCQTAGTHKEYVSAIYQCTDLVTKRMANFIFFWDLLYMLSPDYWRFRRLCATVHRFSMEVIQKRRAALEEMKGVDVLKGSRRKYRDFIDMLLEAKDEDGAGLTDEEIRAEVDTFMFEGHDTTASGLAWLLYNLAKYPEHQEKCRREVDAIFDHKDSLEWDDLKSLPYLKCCIKESLRLFPPVSGVGRTLAQDTKIDGFEMPKGTFVSANFFALHRNPNLWSSPEEFDPSRFDVSESKARPSHSYVPFSAGPRNCIGQEFAKNEELVVMATILHQFEFSLDETKLPNKDYLIILRPTPGLFLKLKPRDQ